jgi:hypothetical protein
LLPSKVQTINKPIFTLYGRPGCYLCDDMLAVLEDLRSEHGFSVVVMDVNARPEWLDLYGEHIPVLSLAGEEICHYFLDMPKVREVLGRFR